MDRGSEEVGARPGNWGGGRKAQRPVPNRQGRPAGGAHPPLFFLCVCFFVCLFVCYGSPALGRAQTLRWLLAHCRSSLQLSSFGTTPRPWGGSLSTEEYEIHSFIYFILSHSLPLLRRWEGGRRPSAPPLDRPYRSHLHATREPGTTPPPTPPVQSNPPTTHLHAQVTATIMINVKIIV